MGFVLDDFAAHFDVGVVFARVGERNFAQRVGHFLDHRVDRKHVHLAGFGIELRAEIFLGAVIFPRRHDHRVFDGRDDDLRFDMLFPADLLDCLVQQTRHVRFSLSYCKLCRAKSTATHTAQPPDSPCESPRTEWQSRNS